MVERNQLLKCSICGNKVIVVGVGGGEITCCGQAMDVVNESTGGDKAPKHLPIITREGDEITVAVGEATHPMDADHYIVEILIFVGNEGFVKFLKPGDEPKLVVKTKEEGEITAKAICNLHGIWTNKL